MKEIIKRKWIKALTSGKYRQNRGSLVNKSLTEHCCLGVLCDLYAKEHGIKINDVYDMAVQFGKNKENNLPAAKVLEWSGLHHQTCDTLADQNDSGSSFKNIAKYIHETL